MACLLCLMLIYRSVVVWISLDYTKFQWKAWIAAGRYRFLWTALSPVVFLFVSEKTPHSAVMSQSLIVLIVNRLSLVPLVFLFFSGDCGCQGMTIIAVVPRIKSQWGYIQCFEKQFLDYGLMRRLMVLLKAPGSMVVTADAERQFHCPAALGKNEWRWKSSTRKMITIKLLWHHSIVWHLLETNNN